jgi:hypothetical protein
MPGRRRAALGCQTLRIDVCVAFGVGEPFGEGRHGGGRTAAALTIVVSCISTPLTPPTVFPCNRIALNGPVDVLDIRS